MPAATTEALMASDLHRADILDPTFAFSTSRPGAPLVSSTPASVQSRTLPPDPLQAKVVNTFGVDSST